MKRTPLRRKPAMTCARGGGFTLVEVLVALVIVVLGMAAVLETLSSSANTIIFLRDKTFAEWVALNQIANLRLQLQPQQVPPTGNTTGEIDYAGRSWHWRQEVVATQVQGMERIDVKVRPADIKAGDDDGWFVTVSGIAGDSLSAPTGTTPVWGSGEQQGGQPGGGGTPGALGGTATPTNGTTNNGTTGTPPTTTTTPPNPTTGINGSARP